jgi:hypothetical protein
MKGEYPELISGKVSSKVYKKILQSVTTYNSRVDVMFAAIEYLEFIDIYTRGVVDTVNNQDILIFITGVPKLDNAYWNGSYMIFGEGDESFYPLTSIDVIGHELTHGFIQGICDLEYKGHSGALNESFADIFGVMLEFYVYEKYKSKLLGKSDWCIGEDLAINDRCLRDMADPNACEQPAKMFDKFYLDPRSMIDYGGVHVNSGIPNHCFYLISQTIDKYASFKLFINCLFKLFKQSDFYNFSNTLSDVSEKNKCIDTALNKIGLPPTHTSKTESNYPSPNQPPSKNQPYPPPPSSPTKEPPYPYPRSPSPPPSREQSPYPYPHVPPSREQSPYPYPHVPPSREQSPYPYPHVPPSRDQRYPPQYPPPHYPYPHYPDLPRQYPYPSDHMHQVPRYPYPSYPHNHYMNIYPPYMY